MWINIKDKLPDLKKFKDGDSINGRYEKIRTMHYSYNDEYKDLEEYNEPYGLMHYEESEPVLVKYKCHFLEDKIMKEQRKYFKWILKLSLCCILQILRIQL